MSNTWRFLRSFSISNSLRYKVICTRVLLTDLSSKKPVTLMSTKSQQCNKKVVELVRSTPTCSASLIKKNVPSHN